MATSDRSDGGGARRAISRRAAASSARSGAPSRRRAGRAALPADDGPPTAALRQTDFEDWSPSGPASGGPPPDRRAGRAVAAHPFRQRILPRSVLGISSLILAFAIGCGFSGVVLFSYYQYKLNQTNDRVNTLISGYKKQFNNAEGDLQSTVASARAQIQSQLQAAQQEEASPATLAALVKALAPSVYFVHTLDANGQPSVGTAFVVSSSATQSLLLTSYTTVEAATHAPAPPVYVRQGTTDTQVTVHSWDAQYDLALIVLPMGGLKPIPAAPSSPGPKPGDHIFAVSGSGTAGASITQGTVIDVAASGLAEDAAIGPAFQGGPLVNQSGQVIAVASRTYAPLGFSSNGVWYAPLVDAACAKVLSCPGGSLVAGQ